MKRLLKAILRRGWRVTGPIRRPLLRKAHALMVRAGADALAGSPLAAQIRADAAAANDRVLPAIHRHLDATAEAARSTTADLDLLLNGMVRELARLQMQVQALQETIEAVADAPAPPADTLRTRASGTAKLRADAART